MCGGLGEMVGSGRARDRAAPPSPPFAAINLLGRIPGRKLTHPMSS